MYQLPIHVVPYQFISSNVPIHIVVHQFMSSYTNSYRRTPIHVVVYQFISSYTNSCRRIPIHIVACQLMSSDVPIQVSSINLAIAIYINYLTNVKYSQGTLNLTLFLSIRFDDDMNWYTTIWIGIRRHELVCDDMNWYTTTWIGTCDDMNWYIGIPIFKDEDIYPLWQSPLEK